MCSTDGFIPIAAPATRANNQDTSSSYSESLSVLENVVYRACRGTPSLFFETELTASFSGDFVRPRAAVMFGRNLACSYPPGLLHSVEGRIQRTFLDAQGIGEALNVRGDRIAMQRAATRKNREDQERQ
jgi:hypothetical protein